MSGLTFYRVQQNDQLFKIVREHYGSAAFLSNKDDIVATVLSNNPDIRNIDRIFPGQVIMLPDMTAQDAAVRAAPHERNNMMINKASKMSRELTLMSEEETDFVRSINFANVAKSTTAGMAEGFIKQVANITQDSSEHIHKIVRDHWRMQSGMISPYQNWDRRVRHIQSLDKQLGVLQTVIHPNRSIWEVLRLDRADGIRPYANLEDEINKLKRINSMARNGGAILTMAKIADGGFRAGMAGSDRQRGVVLLDTAIGLASNFATDKAADVASNSLRLVAGRTAAGATARLGGAAAARALTIFAVGAMATPVGWVGFTVALAANVAVGMAADAIVKAIAEDALRTDTGRRFSTFVGAKAREAGAAVVRGADAITFWD